jgi:hypothetical protein
MAQTSETSERGPWTIQKVLEQLDRIGVFDAKEIHRAPCPEGQTLAAALRDALHDRSSKAKVSAAALLLLFNDRSGREPFLEALAGPDGDVRNLAIDFVQYCVAPYDDEIHGRHLTTCPISRDELFTAVKRDLHEPWTDLNRRILRIVSWQDYPQARSITRPLLTHRDASLRREIAEDYLSAGRDEGAFAVVEEFLRSAPGHVPHGDPRWHDFYQVKGLWHSLKMAAERGDAELRNKAAALAMALVAEALDAPDVKDRFDFNDGLIEAASAAKVLAAVLPSGAQGLLERLIDCDAISEFGRGEALLAYARALGDEAHDFVLSKLGRHDLREYAARAIEHLVKDKNDPHDIAALSDALAGEERSRVVAAIAKALVAAGPAGQAVVGAALDRAEPWARAELSWRLSGGTGRELADLLTEAGVMDPISDEQLAEALSKGFDVLSLIWAGGQRLVTFNVKASAGLEHFELFQELLKVARPVIAVDGLKETCNANRLREPVAGLPNVEKVTDLGTVCTVTFQYQGRAFSFEAQPQGRWHDVPAVMKGFDAFMKSIGRDDRCYELELGGEWALFVVAPASQFEPVAARLLIPLERDSQSARDAAKAYQRQVQSLGQDG